jgi:pimeloyl-ACP methyl ester carboxylesterase
VVQERTVRVGSATLAMARAGSVGGTGVVLLHAGVADRRVWNDFTPALLEDASDCDVVAFDRRGFGATICEPEVYSRVADLAAVLDACDIDRSILVGNSQGGRIAIDFALTHPNRVRALVLIGTAVTNAPTPSTPAPEVARLVDAIDAAEESGDLATVNELEAQLWLDGPGSAAGRVGGRLRRLFLDMNAAALQADDPGDVTDDIDAWGRLGEIGVPTLVMIGSLDLPHLLANSRHIAATVPAAELVVLDGLAHLPTFESPAGCTAIIANFLRRHGVIEPSSIG